MALKTVVTNIDLRALEVEKGMMGVLSSVKKLKINLKNNGVNPLIDVKVDDYSNTVTLEYNEQSGGKFINFCGMMVNTDTLEIVLGYNANTEYYIPICSLTEVLNMIFFGDPKPIITSDDVKYLMEQFKFNYSKFDLVAYVKGLFVNNFKSPFSSIILGFINKQLASKASSGPKVMVDSNIDAYKMIKNFFETLMYSCDALGRLYFGNYIAEESLAQVATSGQDKGFERKFLDVIDKNKLPANFARELSSIGLGRNRRNQILEADFDSAKELAILSGFAYIDVWDTETVKGTTQARISISKIPDEKIIIYNILDLLRAVGSEQDLMFSYRILLDINEPSLMVNLIKKLKLEGEIGVMSTDSLKTQLNNFYKSVPQLLDMGSVYSQKVKFPQKDFAVFSGKEILNAGKIADKMFKRILTKV